MRKIINFEIIENYMKKNNLDKITFCGLCNIKISDFNKIKKDIYDSETFVALMKISGIIKIKSYKLINE